MDVNDITREIISAAIKVHTALGPGLLESANEACLAYELRKRGFKVSQQVLLSIIYDELTLEAGYRIDMIVNDTVFIELKACEAIHPVFEAQVVSYLKLSGKKVGLLINFHVPLLKDGIRRFSN